MQNEYTLMQKSFYDDETISPEDVVGSYGWHEKFPYESQLLFKRGDMRFPLFESTKDKIALDFGCGPGRMVLRMSPLFERVDGVDLIFVTNNDIIFHKGFFAQMLYDATTNKLDALGVPASINEHDLGLGYNLDQYTNKPKKEPPMKRENINEEILKNPLHNVDFPHGGTILFSRNFFIKIGLYDPNLFFGGDELDFLYRVKSYNLSHDDKIKCAVSLKSFLMVDNLSKHNSGHKIIKARGMLQGNAHVNLKHKFTPLQIGLYKEQYELIKNLSKGLLTRYLALYIFSLRGLIIEIYKYYTK